MTPEEAAQIVTDYDGAVKSLHYLEWNLETLLGVKDKLREARQVLLSYPHYLQQCNETLEKIKDRILAKEAEAKAAEEAQISEQQRLRDQWVADRRHKENKQIQIFGIVVAAIVALVIGWWTTHSTQQQPSASTPQPKTPQLYNQPSTPTPTPTPLRVSTPAISSSPKPEPESTSTPKP